MKIEKIFSAGTWHWVSAYQNRCNAIGLILGSLVVPALPSKIATRYNVTPNLDTERERQR